ncbi:MAG TPA: RidA family protein [Candidatus Eisenbacteria bacterium]|nr:RidA family protein [Candidatus Eisenbacteria bacterium]
MPFELLNPEGLENPVGYSHIAHITGGRLVHVAGQAPFDANGQVVGKDDFVAQFTQVMRNLKTAIAAVGGQPHQYAVLTMYVTDVEAYWKNRKALGVAYSQIFGKFFPAITLVEVRRLYNPDCMIEVSGIAVLD